MTRQFAFVRDDVRNAIIEECAKVADLSSANAATEDGQKMAIGIAACIRALIVPPAEGKAP